MPIDRKAVAEFVPCDPPRMKACHRCGQNWPEGKDGSVFPHGCDTKPEMGLCECCAEEWPLNDMIDDVCPECALIAEFDEEGDADG